MGAHATHRACPTCGGHVEVGQCVACAWNSGEDNPWRWTPGEQHTIDELPIRYVSGSVPFSHQIAALAKAYGKPAFAYLMEMGTGKSKVGIDEWAALVREKASRDIVIEAPAGVYRGWVQQLIDHLDPEIREEASIGLWESGATVRRRDQLSRLLRERDRPRILLMNIEAHSGSGRATEYCREFLETSRDPMMIIDESTVIRNPQSIRTQEIMDLREHVRYRRIMTGMPTPRAPLDLFSQFEFLDWRILEQRSWFGFRARYAITRNIPVQRTLKNGNVVTREQPIVVGYRNVSELRDLISPHAFRVLKRECLDLPEKIYAPVHTVQMTDEQARIYRDLEMEATAELDALTHVTASDIMTRRTRLHQVACGFATDENKQVHYIKSNRMQAMLDVLEEADWAPTIIWAPYIPLLRQAWTTLQEKLGRDRVVRFWGEVPTNEREDAVRRFEQDSRVVGFLGNPAAGGRGRTLVRAEVVLYLANGDDLEIRLNSEDRAHRIGLRHPVLYVDLQVPGTVEVRRVDNMRRKLDLASSVLGEPRQDWLK